MDDDSDYASEADSDFAPEPAVEQISESSAESESEIEVAETDVPSKQKKKRKRKDVEEAEDLGFENSGDEAIVNKGLKRQKKAKANAKEVENEDDGGDGEGLFVRTRTMAARALQEEKRPLATTDAATVDVDALWKSMMNGPTIPPTTSLPPLVSSETTESVQKQNTVIENEDASMITIKRTYNFAGKIHTESKLVPRDSAEARLYLASASKAPENQSPPDTSSFEKARRRPKARRSIFEPVIESFPQRTDLHFGAAAIARLKLGTAVDKGKKLNTVEKSKMDWAGFVDKEGIKEELEGAGKAKKAEIGQAEFLARVEGKREEEARRARIKASGM